MKSKPSSCATSNATVVGCVVGSIVGDVDGCCVTFVAFEPVSAAPRSAKYQTFAHKLGAISRESSGAAAVRQSERLA